MKKPLIGITLDEEDSKTYSKYPWYAARKNYSSSIEKAGGICIFLPNNLTAIDFYLNLINGLVVTGGDFDIDPKIYGEEIKSSKVTTKKDRTNFEFSISKKAIEKNIPLLGICGGQQLINVVQGGTLIQHLPDYKQSKINHEQTNPRDQASHYVNIYKNSKLYQYVKTEKMFVNSAHHQAVKDLGDNLIVNAYSEDGIIEGIEAIDKTFCVGVQWHPEFLIDKNDLNILKSFVKISKEEIGKKS
mgnify:CR=1 FL=1